VGSYGCAEFVPLQGMVSFKKEWGLPLGALGAYALFIPCLLLCSANMQLAMLAAALGLAVIVCDLALTVERYILPNEVLEARSGEVPLLLDLVVVLRVLSTTLAPGIMASFGGASFLALTSFGHLAEGCQVADLPRLAMEGYTAFACHDGFVHVGMQTTGAAWENHPAGSRGLGYVAPIFTSRDAFAAGDAPVAWAVKAGSRVRQSICDDLAMQTCGFFAGRLQEEWNKFPAFSRFGQAWGYNITHFSADNMLKAVEDLRTDPEHPLPRASTEVAGQEAFVVAEGPTEYFGIASPLLYVTYTLLAVGLLDRISAAAHGRVLAMEEEGNLATDYDQLVLQGFSDVPAAAAEAGQVNGLWAQVDAFWNDPLNTSKLHSLHDTMHPGPPASARPSMRTSSVAPVMSPRPPFTVR